MSRLNEITSTEKLLDFIRNKNSGTPIHSREKKNSLSFSKKYRIPGSNKAYPKGKMVVGIDIGHKYLRLVKAVKEIDNRWKLLDYKSVPFVHVPSGKSDEFTIFLKSQILNFGGDSNHLSLWAIMSAANVNVRHIRIPKVAKKQIENAVYWTIKKETPFDEKDTIFDFEIQREITEQGVKKWLVMVYTAPRGEVDEINRMFSRMGLHLTGISITPFSIQNIFCSNWIPSEEGSIASLFIGNDFSRIDIFDQGKLIMTRGIKAGVNSMVELMMEKLMMLRDKKALPDDTLPTIKQEEARKILFSLSPDSPPLEENEIGYGLTEEEKFNIILPALERVVRQVERTFEHYTIQLKNNKVSKIYVSTAMNIYNPFIDYVGEQLSINSEILDPIKLLLDDSEKDVQQTPPSERVALVPALGLSLSDNEYTPNLLFRYKDKEKLVRSVQINRIASMIMIATILIASMAFLYQVQAAYQKENTISRLESELLRYSPRIDKDTVSKLASIATNHNKMMKAYGEKYLGMAVIGEIAEITPTNIRLISVKTNLAASATAKSGETSKDASGKEPAKELVKNVIIEGVIMGDHKMLDSMLAGYIMKLESSPIFRQIIIQKNTIEPFKKTDILHFILNVKIG